MDGPRALLTPEDELPAAPASLDAMRGGYAKSLDVPEGAPLPPVPASQRGWYDPASESPPAQEESYPRLWPLVDILDHWNPDDVRVPRSYYEQGAFASIKVLDWNDPKQRKEAEALRNAELPFVVRGVPELLEVNRRWTNPHLATVMGSHAKQTETNEGNHFMYWNRGARDARAAVKQGGTSPSGWEQPTIDTKLTYSDWIKKAEEGERDIMSGNSDNKEARHWYFRASSKQKSISLPPSADPGRDNTFVADDLDIFRPENNFFIVDPSQQRGIHCRFGMAGIIAENHYDGGRNFISMVRGKKRYILAPPSECPNMDLLKAGPSARHSEHDWTDPSQYRSYYQ